MSTTVENIENTKNDTVENTKIVMFYFFPSDEDAADRFIGTSVFEGKVHPKKDNPNNINKEVNKTYIIKLLLNSKYEDIEGILANGKQLQIVENLPTIKKVIIPELNKSYKFEIIYNSDTLRCQEYYINDVNKMISLICKK